MMPLMLSLIGRLGGGLPPALEMFAGPDLAKALDYIGAGIGDGPFLMGKELTLADMQMSYCVALIDAGGFLADRPALGANWRNLQTDSGFKRMIKVGGPLMMAFG